MPRFDVARVPERLAQVIAIGLLGAGLAGCTTLGSSGPSAGRIKRVAAAQPIDNGIVILPLTAEVAQHALAANRAKLFSEVLGDGAPGDTVIGRGDAIDVSIWEAPPAVLFGSIVGDPVVGQAAQLGRTTSLPQQMIDSTGRITIPFAGSILAAGRTTRQVEQEIVARLQGKAHAPQAIVRLVRNETSNVTVVGDVATSGRIALTARVERLLDALASAGGTKQPVGKTTIQITRGPQVASMPLEDIIRDPRQNIRLQADDVVTALFQPYSFTALGAVLNNAEIPFEGTGITLSQALGRVGGLLDNRADVRGVFIFRFERPDALPPQLVSGARTTPDGRIPVIYRINLQDPASFFIAQSFPIHDKDVFYVSNAPGVDLQKFVSVISSTAFSVVGLTQAVR